MWSRPLIILGHPHLHLCQYVIFLIYWWTPNIVLQMRPQNYWIEQNHHCFWLLAAFLLTLHSVWLAFVTHIQLALHLTPRSFPGNLSSSQPVLLHGATPSLVQDFTLHWTPQGSSCQTISPGPTEWWLPASISNNLVPHLLKSNFSPSSRLLKDTK